MIEVLAKEVVKSESIPDFANLSKNEEKAKENEVLSPMELTNIYDRTHGMTKEQKRVTLMCMPSEMLFAELERRNDLAHGVLSDLRDKLHEIRSNMDLADMSKLIMEVQRISMNGGEQNGK